MNHTIIQQPSVGVVIAVYNSENTVGRAILSALAEPEVTEVIVIDDVSTDSTVQTARGCDDGSNRLKVFIQEKNGGPSPARNRAIKESTASWIAILDADDFFLPGRIRKLLAHTDRADFIADDLCRISEDGVNNESFFGDAPKNPKFIGFEEFVLSNITDSKRPRSELGFMKPMMSRTFLMQHRLNYPPHMRLGEDFALYARALALGARLLLIPDQGYVSIERNDSLSHNHSEADLVNLRECGRGLQKDFSLTPRERKALYRHYLSIDCRLQWRRLIAAVKSGDMKAAADTFRHPSPVPLYLTRKLCEQLYLYLSGRAR
jgi:succinoglycan biosynthesis protein ExoU